VQYDTPATLDTCCQYVYSRDLPCFIISCVDTTDTSSSDTVPSRQKINDVRDQPGTVTNIGIDFSVQNAYFVPRYVQFQS